MDTVTIMFWNITAEGPVQPETGLAVHIPTLDRLVSEQVLRDFDHRYMNADLDEFRGLVPTSENIMRVIEDRLMAHWSGAFPSGRPHLEAIRLRETKRNVFELKP